ncbi:MAG: response regulator [Anaerolineae bacterium]
MADEKSRILIVEDDLDLSEMLNAYFSVQNYEVRTAAWGQEALKISAEESFDLVVLDIRLPDINGYEVCRQLRIQRRTQDVPIIFLTEKRDRVDKLQGLELGVVDYITKPFDIQELRLRVRNAIQRSNQQTMISPVTELPERPLVDEKINHLVFAEYPWAMLGVSLDGLNTLREIYGFVAADELLRAVTLMIRNAVREFGNDDDFIGHWGPEEFVILTTVDRTANIRNRIETRVRQSIEHFYRPKEEDGEAVDGKDFLKLKTCLIDHTGGPYKDADAIKDALTVVLPAHISSKPKETN